MSSYSEGQIHQLVKRLEKEGFTRAHITKLGQLKNLQSLREVLDDRAEIKPLPFIDCDADPFLLKDWTVEEHIKGGQIKWNPDEVVLYLSRKQKHSWNDDDYINGVQLQKELKNKKVLNANVMDFLLKKENRHLIPDEWEKKVVFFWGTIYKNSVGDLFVRSMSHGGKWGADYRRINNNNCWNENNPAAIRK